MSEMILMKFITSDYTSEVHVLYWYFLVNTDLLRLCDRWNLVEKEKR